MSNSGNQDNLHANESLNKEEDANVNNTDAENNEEDAHDVETSSRLVITNNLLSREYIHFIIEENHHASDDSNENTLVTIDIVEFFFSRKTNLC